jgi:hypothetical protein
MEKTDPIAPPTAGDGAKVLDPAGLKAAMPAADPGRPAPPPTSPPTGGKGKIPKGAEGKVDKLGRPFDPALHEVDGNGKARITKQNKLTIKRGNNGGVNRTSTAIIPPDPAEAAKLAEQAKLEALALVDFALMLPRGVFGDEWKPQDDERQNLANSWAPLVQQWGASGPPPWAMALMGTAAFAAPRLRKPKTAEKIKGAFGWVKGMFAPKAVAPPGKPDPGSPTSPDISPAAAAAAPSSPVLPSSPVPSAT